MNEEEHGIWKRFDYGYSIFSGGLIENFSINIVKSNVVRGTS